jgi:hypothetical protein
MVNVHLFECFSNMTMTVELTTIVELPFPPVPHMQIVDRSWENEFLDEFYADSVVCHIRDGVVTYVAEINDFYDMADEDLIQFATDMRDASRVGWEIRVCKPEEED